MKTGPHSFKDATGVEWHIVGYSKNCGAAYVDCRSADGKALTVRPVAYLGPAGLTIPEDAPPPERPATAHERARAEERYEAMPVKDIVPEAEQTTIEKPKRKRAPKKPKVVETDMQDIGGQVIAFPVPEVEQTPAETLRAAITEAGDGDKPPPRRACGHKFYIRTCEECKKDRERARVVNKHTSGWDVDIARPGPWGNPYSHEPNSTAQHVVGSREEAIDLYRQWLKQRVRAGEPGLVPALAALHGLRLGCTCAPLPCHGDVLVDAAEWAASVTHEPS